MRVVQLAVRRLRPDATLGVALPHVVDPLPGGDDLRDYPEPVEHREAVGLEDQADALRREPRPALEDRHAQPGVRAEGGDGEAREPGAHDGDVDALGLLAEHQPRWARVWW